MASKFTELGIGCADPGSLARFWCSVLDYEVQDGMTELSQLAGRWRLKAGIAMTPLPSTLARATM